MPKLLQKGQVIADVQNYRAETVDASGPARGCKFTFPSGTGFDIDAEPHGLDFGDGRVKGIMVVHMEWAHREATAVFNPQPDGL